MKAHNNFPSALVRATLSRSLSLALLHIAPISILFALGIIFAPRVAAAYVRWTPPKYENRSKDHEPFFESAQFDSAIPRPLLSISQDPNARPMRIAEIHEYFRALDAASDRVAMFEMGQTHEGRQLVYLAIGSPENLAKLESIKSDHATLANPKAPYGGATIENIIKMAPAVAWMGYSIHGDEISGSDASVAVAYRLAAGLDETTKLLLDSLVIIIDPSENPDGRERYLAMLTSHASEVTTTDAQSQQHGGVWPYGRANHYLFDLNRDWILLEHPETRARVKTILEWNPQTLVDAHEMGAYSSFLFNPPREPLNPNIPDTTKSWWRVFANDQARAFDAHGWNYYTQEWYEGWYPGYTDGFAWFVGAVGILYEQSGTDGLPTKQSDGYIQTYREAVQHQYVSSIANLTTTARNRQALLRSFYSIKTAAIEAGKAKSPRQYVISAARHPERADQLCKTLIEMGAQVERTTAPATLASGTNQFREKVTNSAIPAGSYVVPLDQPLRPLINSAMEFDPRMTKRFLEDERRELEKWGQSKLYEFSAWSLPLAYDVDVIATDAPFTAATERVTTAPQQAGRIANPDPQYGWLIDYASDDAPAAAVRLMDAGYKLQSSSRAFQMAGVTYAPGALLIRKEYNDNSVGAFLESLAKELNITIVGVNTALSQRGSDLGADSFVQLELPRVGLFGGPGTDFTSYGFFWNHLDKVMGARHSLLNLSELSQYDLERYNVLVIPQAFGIPDIIGSGGLQSLQSWVKNGGTLICVGSSMTWACDSATGLSQVRARDAVLDKLEEYSADNSLELFQRAPGVDTGQIWNYRKPSVAAKEDDKPQLSTDERRRVESRATQLFQPRGVIFNVRLDNERWPAFGCQERVGAGLYVSTAYMSKSPTQTIGRISDAESCRLSGLLWPEARELWAGTAYMTRESMGSGQVILFADDPCFRGYWRGTARLFSNCIALGPGFGTNVSVGW